MPERAPEIAGVWILRSAEAARTGGGVSVKPYGEAPRGVLMLHESGRMAAVITPRDPPFDTAADKAAAYHATTAYSGRYRLEAPARFITEVDVSAFPPWIGTSQARNYTLNGDELRIVTDPVPSRFFDGEEGVTVLVWERELKPA